MISSPELLEKFEHFGSIFATVAEVAVLLDIDRDIILEEFRNPGSPLRKAYMRGKVNSVVELKEQEMKLAKMGSPVGLDSVRRSLVEIGIEDV